MGVFIKNARLDKGITQEKLCSGLCDVSTLSRIERGINTPSSYLLNALMERLGFYSSGDRNILLVDDTSKLMQQMKALSVAMTQRDLEAGFTLLSEFEADVENESMGKPNNLAKQFLLKSKVVFEMFKGEDEGMADTKWCLNTLREAILITIPDFDESSIREYRLTKEEISCINAMSGAYVFEGDFEGSLKLQLALKDNMDKFIVNNYDLMWSYSTTLYNIVVMLCALERYDECRKAFFECRDFCIKHNDFSRFPMLYLVYGKCLTYTGKLDEAKSILTSAYHTALIYGRDNEAESISDFFRSVYEGGYGHYSHKFDVNRLLTDKDTDTVTDKDADIHALPENIANSDTSIDFDIVYINRLLTAMGNSVMSAKEVMSRLDLKHMNNFRANYLLPALRKGYISMTIPDKPSDKRQRYKVVKGISL